MPIKSLSRSSLLSFEKYSSMLAGNAAFAPSAYDLLETEILTGTQSSVTFSSLNSTYGADYQHLQIRATMDATGNFGTVYDVFATLNGDTGSNYDSHHMRGTGSTVYSAYSSSATNFIALTNSTTSAGASFSAAVIDILDPFETTKYTTLRSFTGSASYQVGLQSVLWRNTAALTTFTLTPHGSTSFVAGSRFSLYGLKAA